MITKEEYDVIYQACLENTQYDFIEELGEFIHEKVEKHLDGYYNFLMEEFDGNASEEAITMYLEKIGQ